MNLSPEHLQTLLAQAGVLGPNARATVPNTNVTTKINGAGSLPVNPPTVATALLFFVTFLARDPTSRRISAQRFRVLVRGQGAAGPGVVVSNASEFTNTDIANPPVFTVTLNANGLELDLNVQNPVAGNPVDAEAYVIQPLIQSQ